MDTNTHTPRRSQHKHEHVLVLVLTLPQYVCSVADNQCGNYFLSENSIFFFGRNSKERATHTHAAVENAPKHTTKPIGQIASVDEK